MRNPVEDIGMSGFPEYFEAMFMILDLVTFRSRKLMLEPPISRVH